MPYTSTQEVTLYYEIHGDGPPLVLIAGMTADSRSWKPILKGFSSHFTTVVFDNRGVGRTTGALTGLTISGMADDTLQLMDNLGLAPADIVGHSMGGYIAQEIAINYPGRVNRLVLASTAPATSTRNKALFMNMLEQRRSGLGYEA